MEVKAILQTCLARGIPLNPLPVNDESDRNDVPHAPKRAPNLTAEEFKLAVKNALRYFPKEFHKELAPEFAAELRNDGHIYMRRFRPREYYMKAYPIDYYPGNSVQAKSLMLMAMNNLSPEIAQYPHELITYGGNGSVFSNWAQYHLFMAYLCQVSLSQTLVMSSGHPAGLFPSTRGGPLCVITNGMVIPNYSSGADYNRMYALGVSQYGQMTAGSFCYIGPQGIVHGTTLVILNAVRKYLNGDFKSRVYVSSGLGGMSGAQGKAATICGITSVIAEIDIAALKKRLAQGWIDEIVSDLDQLISKLSTLRKSGGVAAIGFWGNIVTLLERLGTEEELLVDIGSDQTSLHNAFGGGYYPVSLSFEESRQPMAQNPDEFKKHVRSSLVRHCAAVNLLTSRGMKFWDYGNSFLLECGRSNADVYSGAKYRYPTYIQEFLGDIFSLGFGPFRWVCCSGKTSDLSLTDKLASDVLESALVSSPERVAHQLKDNLMWIHKAEEHKLVVGSQARILYADSETRCGIAVALNNAIREGLLGPVVLSRDHHDVSGTDSPYRETSNITDGSMFCADMSVHNCIGDSFRGATWVALHNGGGCGWGEVMNGGFGLVLDGSDDAESRARSMLFWDVNNGVARRAWSGNENANFAIEREMERTPNLKVTLPVHADDDVLNNL